MTDWFVEKLHPEVTQCLLMDAVLHSSRTAFQDVLVFENSRLGRVLVLDQVLQTTERDEYFYHEMMAHLPILAHGRAMRILIIGGGDGGVLRRCLQHSVDKVTMVEIDPGVVEICKRHLPSISDGAFTDPRVEIVFKDGSEFVAEAGETYDVIIIDSTDPVGGPGDVLFTETFYADCKKRLAPRGVLVNQSGNPFLEPQTLRNNFTHLNPAFADVSCYVSAVPTYYGGYLAHGWATDDRSLRQHTVEEIRTRFAAAQLKTRCYTPELHVASFALPRLVEGLMS